MHLRELEHFVAIAREGGIGRAARVLNISQPTLTRSIAQLEHGLGVRLFERSKRGTIVTNEGHRLLPHAQAILNEADRMRSVFASGLSSSIEQTLIGISPNLLVEHLPRAIGAFLRTSPELAVAVQTGTFEILTQAVRAHEIEFALCVVPDSLAQSGRYLTDLSIEAIIDEQFVPFAMPGHPALDEEPSLVALARHGWAVPHQMSLSYRFESVFFRRGLVLPVQQLNCGSMSLLVAGVRDMGLIGLLPRSIEAFGGGICPIELPELTFGSSIALVTARGRGLTPSAQALIEALRAEATRSAAA